jgi:hypothetical protein
VRARQNISNHYTPASSTNDLIGPVVDADKIVYVYRIMILSLVVIELNLLLCSVLLFGIHNHDRLVPRLCEFCRIAAAICTY